MATIHNTNQCRRIITLSLYKMIDHPMLFDFNNQVEVITFFDHNDLEEIRPEILENKIMPLITAANDQDIKLAAKVYIDNDHASFDWRIGIKFMTESRDDLTILRLHGFPDK